MIIDNDSLWENWEDIEWEIEGVGVLVSEGVGVGVGVGVLLIVPDKVWELVKVELAVDVEDGEGVMVFVRVDESDIV